MKLSLMIQIMAECGVSSHPTRAELDELSQLKGPVILHWDFSHFVVLERVDRNALHIIDPAVGRRRILLADASRHFTGIVLEPDGPESATGPRPHIRPNSSVLSSLLPSWSQSARTVVPALLIVLLSNILALVLPLFLKLAYEFALPKGQKITLIALASGFILVALGQLAIQISRIALVAAARNGLTRYMCGQLIRNLLMARPEFFEGRPATRTSSQYQSVQSISTTLTEQFLSNGIDAVFVLLGVALLIILAPMLGVLVALGVSAHLLILKLNVGEVCSRLTGSLQAEMVEHGFVFESIESIAAIKLYGAEALRLSMWQNVHSDVQREQQSYWSRRNLVSALQDFVTSGTWILAGATALRFVMIHRLSLGTATAIISWIALVLARSKEVSQGGLAISLLKTHVAKVEDVVRAPKAQLTHGLIGNDSALPGAALSIRDLSFRYSERTPWILNSCTLEAAAGEMIGITGDTGAGKTTLFKAIAGLLEPQHVRTEVDGVEGGDEARSILRGMSGYVMQGDVLVSGTVLDNIAFFDPQPSLELAAECARLACIDNFIERLPMCYGAIVGRRGQGFSAGEIQRILLARAFYRRPRVLILDEFTSNLDRETERRLLKNIKLYGATVVAIAHRTQVISACDRVYRLENCRLEAVCEEPIPVSIVESSSAC